MADMVRETGLKYRNWGKWGTDDELGTLNYITPEGDRGGGSAREAGQGVFVGDPLQQ